jgi:bacterioferritin (cytochrome b1)
MFGHTATGGLKTWKRKSLRSPDEEVPIVSMGLLRQMNIAIAKEEELSMQCMWQHYMLLGTDSEAISSVLMQLAINESRRVEIITRILGCLGQPFLKKRQVCVIENIDDADEMLRRNRDRVDDIIASYKDVIVLAQEEEECLLKESFTELLAEQNKHRALIEVLLEGSATEAVPDTG